MLKGMIFSTSASKKKHFKKKGIAIWLSTSLTCISHTPNRLSSINFQRSSTTSQTLPYHTPNTTTNIARHLLPPNSRLNNRFMGNNEFDRSRQPGRRISEQKPLERKNLLPQKHKSQKAKANFRFNIRNHGVR
jgi:hypothetical protein